MLGVLNCGGPAHAADLPPPTRRPIPRRPARPPAAQPPRARYWSVPTYRDEAVVLRTHKLGEADRIVTMLSRHHGKIRAVAKGVRRTGSRFGSRLEPFMVADVQLYVGRSLDIVQQAESLGSYGAEISDDYGSYTAASVMVETADKVTDDDGGGVQQYLLLVGALRHAHFVVQLGGMVAADVAPPGSPRVSPEALALLAALLTGDWATADASDERARNQASGIIAAYTQFHLERGLRSLPHVDRQAVTAPTSSRAAAAPAEAAPEHPPITTPGQPAPLASTIQESALPSAPHDTPTIGAPA